jgi:hypothetical protein
MVVAMDAARRGTFLANQPSDSTALRGLETTVLLGNAKRFPDQAALDAWVAILGGVVGNWVAMLVP